MPITICNSPETLKAEIESLRKKVALDETEETWDTITQAIQHLTRLCNIGGCQFPSETVTAIRSISRPLNNALNSERSRLSGAAVELVTALATGLGSSFEPLVSQFVPTLLVLCGRTNKVFTSRARACILAIIQHTHLPSLLPYLAELASHKSVFPRLTAAEGILACLNCFNPPDLEKETRVRVVEDFIKLTARDASGDVRKATKQVFRAYKALMPGRAESFVAPLTPVVKKYLDIQTGNHGVSSNPLQKQSSRPSSRANNVTEVGQRPASATLTKPPARPATDGSVHCTRQQPAFRGPPAVVDVHPPRQRTVSQMQRDPPPRNLRINTQSSSTAQRCIVPASAPARPAVQYPAPGIARALPARNASSSAKGPQRPPPAQMKFNLPPDRLKVPGNGAKRIPLPSIPANGQSSGQVTASAESADLASTAVNNPHSKLPSRHAEAIPSARPAVARRAVQGHRSASSSTKPTKGSALTAPVVAQRSNTSVKDKMSNPSRVVPQPRPVGKVQKDTRSLVQAERKETSPALIPLPPSPTTMPTKIPLPASPDCEPRDIDAEVQDEPVVASLSEPTDPAGKQSRSAEPCQEQRDIGPPSTPITTLLASIQRGFLFTPSSPLSPPQNYLATLLAPGNLPEKGQDTMIASDPTTESIVGVPFCISLEDGSVADGSDRHALRDLN